ncbi:hypothetical protein HYH03_002580 [Edaphochlamys debaryana]|uniref:Protein kinase domain-containing protein n=1 Tax=Edaphochlamys debaryana TaxID=47281 RepID=A0A835YEW9_9CHLO|nr:hypothetical protein HYH03_002580 [Edaphochlamys debaryana]|eukprot:KAG2499641.1 hypothetical protein HYH03_002580 [Edaphochlamys debaryana]
MPAVIPLVGPLPSHNALAQDSPPRPGPRAPPSAATEAPFGNSAWALPSAYQPQHASEPRHPYVPAFLDSGGLPSGLGACATLSSETTRSTTPGSGGGSAKAPAVAGPRPGASRFAPAAGWGNSGALVDPGSGWMEVRASGPGGSRPLQAWHGPATLVSGTAPVSAAESGAFTGSASGLNGSGLARAIGAASVLVSSPSEDRSAEAAAGAGAEGSPTGPPPPGTEAAHAGGVLVQEVLSPLALLEGVTLQAQLGAGGGLAGGHGHGSQSYGGTWRGVWRDQAVAVKLLSLGPEEAEGADGLHTALACGALTLAGQPHLLSLLAVRVARVPWHALASGEAGGGAGGLVARGVGSMGLGLGLPQARALGRLHRFLGPSSDGGDGAEADAGRSIAEPAFQPRPSWALWRSVAASLGASSSAWTGSDVAGGPGTALPAHSPALEALAALQPQPGGRLVAVIAPYLERGCLAALAEARGPGAAGSSAASPILRTALGDVTAPAADSPPSRSHGRSATTAAAAAGPPAWPFAAARGWSRHVAARALLRSAREVAAALAALHAAGHAHGGVTPSNCLLEEAAADRRGFVLRLADAGTAALGGWVAAMAPEALLDAAALRSAPADVYGYGMLLLYMATGSMPFADEPLASLCLAGPSHALRPAWPQGGANEPLELLFRRCTALEPGERPSMAEVLEELAALEAQLKQRRPRRGRR